MEIKANDEIQHHLDNPIPLRCPLCGVQSGMVPVSIPRFGLIQRFGLSEVGVVCRCNSCNGPVFLKYKVSERFSSLVRLSGDFEQVTVTLEPFEMQYLSGAVAEDFTEALTCYAASCWNAFAAMCRRCIQSVGTSLGAEGTSKVQAQILELRAMGLADAETFDTLQEIMLAGHDGAHPHLAELSPARASVLLQLMKDVLYQLFVRPAKIRESSELRKRAIGG